MSNFESMLIRVFIFWVIVCSFSTLTAQNDAYGEATVVYTNQFYAGGKIMTSGFGLKGILGKYEGYKTIKFKSIEFLKLKHPKELKLTIIGGNSTRRLVFGKSNAFQTLRIGFGKKQLISDKIRKGAMAIGYSYNLGPSIGLLKPVYVDLIESRRSERYDPQIHDLSQIRGRSSFFRGVFETKIRPGIFLNAAILFEFSSDRDGIQQLEVGGSIDAFAERIPIIANAEAKQFFINLFLSYTLGKKYNKN